ncbi:MAG: DUF2199 domain-containing protein [Propionibacteriaceae bacterium]|jgi:hypothetical protein|nr:DUF2199 domain-containing protein [Propionibacteriaceae bacterium]
MLPSEAEDRSWVCPACQEGHVRVPELLGPRAPDAWLAATEGERLEAELTQDICILPFSGDTRYFIRGHIQLPVHDEQLPVFIWSVWAEVDLATMTEIARSWTHPNRAAMPHLPGRLATELPYEQATGNLEISIITRDLGQPPLFALPAGSRHVLATEQVDGVDLARVAQLAHLMQRD